MKSEVYTRKMDTPDELLAPILDAAARIKEREDLLRRTERDLRTEVARCIEVGGGIFECLFWTVTNLSFLCNKFVI
jgi:23S rRNA A1618 N6-methylase RlmF